MGNATDRISELRIDRGTRSRMPRPVPWLVGGILLLAAVGLAGWWWIHQQAPIVRAAVVQETTGGGAGAVLNASGYVTARRKATVSSKITGKVVEVLVEEGMPVRKGQVLARLDDTTAHANLALVEAELEASRQALAEIEVRLHEANLNLGRVQTLVAEGVGKQADLDAAQAEANALKARLALGREQVAVGERQVAVRRREVEDTVIYAPFTGVAISKDAQPGEMISPVSAGGGFTRTGICTIVDMDSLEIEVDVNESFIARVTPGQRVEAVLDAYPEWRIPAHVITTVPAADRQKATVRVRIGFEQLDPRILPDMGVKVTFLGEPREEAARRLLIPRGAVRREDGRDVVYVLNQDRVERRAITLGALSEDTVEVTAGLQAGEQVVVEGPENLKDGSVVRVRTTS